MYIKTQIYSFIYSFVFGILFGICTQVNYKYLFNKHKYFRIIFTIIYIIDASLLYFLLIKYINGGIVNIYFLITVGIGFIIESTNYKKYLPKIRTLLNKCKVKIKWAKNLALILPGVILYLIRWW